MDDDIQAVEINQTWNLVSLLVRNIPIVVKWIYKVKCLPYGSVAKHKARLVAKGFLQKSRLDFT